MDAAGRLLLLGPVPDVYDGAIPEAAALDEDEKTEKEISDRTWGCAGRSTIPAFYFPNR